MNEVEQFANFFINIGFLIIISIIFINQIKKWLVSKNRINLLLIFYLLMVIVHSIWQSMTIIEIHGDITIGVNLTIFNIFYLILLLVPLEFLNYVKNWKMLYSLPIVACFFITYGLILNGNAYILSLMSMVASIFMSAILIFEGNRNKNGTSISLGLFIFLFGLEFIPSFLFPGMIIKLAAALILLAGSFGYFEKYLFVDQKAEEKIKNTWIAKIVDISE